MAVLTRVRSLLFMPGTRADMIAKIARIRPDVAAVDLEDAVAPGDKEAARDTAVAAIDALEPGAATTVLVRVNPVGTPWFAADVAAASRCALSPDRSRRTNCGDWTGGRAKIPARGGCGQSGKTGHLPCPGP